MIKGVFRLLRKNAVLNIINVLCMALGLVSSGIIVSYIYQEYHYDCDYPNSGSVYRVIQKEGESQNTVTFSPLASALKSSYPEIDDALRVSFYYGYLPCSSGESKTNERFAIFADPGFFDFFSFPLTEGRSNDCLASPNSVVISESASRKYFGGNDPVGELLRIGADMEFTITGVFQDFKDNSNFTGDLVLPLVQISKLTQVWIEPSWEYESDIHTFVLLNVDAGIEDISGKAKNLINRYIPGSKMELLFQPMDNIHVNRDLMWESKAAVNVTYLRILLLVALLTLGISMANFLFLYIGTAVRRSTGTGIKKVYGASKHRLFAEHFKEVVVLMFLSTVAAVFLFVLYQGLIIPHFSFLPRIMIFNLRLFLLLFVIILFVTILSGLYPAVVLSSQNPVRLLNHKIPARRGQMMMVNTLVVTQFTLCMALIVSTVVMHRQTRQILNQETGFARDELITIPLNMHLGEGIYGDEFETFVQELKAYPGIIDATLSSSSPSVAFSNGDDQVTWKGKPEDQIALMSWESISYDYFKTLGVPLKQGRAFSHEFPNDQVNWESRQCSYIINERAAKEMGFVDPIGKEMEVWEFHGPIVGVVKDYNFRSLHSEIGPIFYQFNPVFWSEIILRIDPAVPSVINDIERVWDKFVPDYPFEINYVMDQIRDLYQEDRGLADTMNLFSLLAILIASMGLLTLTVLATNQRIKEIGIRKVNGANTFEILALLNKDFIRLVAVAFVMAVPIAWYAMHRWLQNFAYKTHLCWWIFGLAGLLAMGIAIITVSWISWQAASSSPADALRNE
jgi:putative ABC transport system permease protein